MGCEIGTIIISDHDIVELHIEFNVEKERKGCWRLNTMLLLNEASSSLIQLCSSIVSCFFLLIGGNGGAFTSHIDFPIAGGTPLADSDQLVCLAISACICRWQLCLDCL